MDPAMSPVRDSTTNLRLLCELLFNPSVFSALPRTGDISKTLPERPAQTSDSDGDLEELRTLAMTNHVIIRAFQQLHKILEREEKFAEAEWVSDALKQEQSRIQHAIGFLERICETLERNGCAVTVIKSLDHWPDLGSDLDLYTNAEASKVVAVMQSHFQASVADRSWGDRLANKWNFVVPGLPELIEVHIGRLGQTGEHTTLTRSLCNRNRALTIGGHNFRVAAPEDRIIISTLQRMYRHFYIRLCDVVDNAALLDAHVVDFGYLHSLASAAGIWDGVATYLTIISEYVEAYRGYGVPLPSLVTGSAKFNAGKIRFRKDFLRVPILPDSMNLYARELTTLLLRGELRNSLRLSLLPGLATAAALEQKFTGSDKGIW
jgi:hypothetical protein